MKTKLFHISAEPVIENPEKILFKPVNWLTYQRNGVIKGIVLLNWLEQEVYIISTHLKATSGRMCFQSVQSFLC